VYDRISDNASSARSLLYSGHTNRCLLDGLYRSLLLFGPPTVGECVQSNAVAHAATVDNS